MEKLRDQFARETDPAKLKEIAEAAQLRAFECPALVLLSLRRGCHAKHDGEQD